MQKHADLANPFDPLLSRTIASLLREKSSWKAIGSFRCLLLRSAFTYSETISASQVDYLQSKTGVLQVSAGSDACESCTLQNLRWKDLLVDIDGPSRVSFFGLGLQSLNLRFSNRSLQERVDELTRRATSLLGREVNLSSPQQISQILFEVTLRLRRRL